MSGETIRGSKLAISAVAMCASWMAVLDISIVNVALNEIRASFGTPIDQIAWVSTAYLMASIVVIPMTGWLQRKFGYRRYFVASVLLFTVASVLCGLSWNLPSLLAFRVMQGVGGGAILPTSQAILFARYPREEHPMANALFGLGALTGPLLGPTVGGYLINYLSWHWIFFINVPFGLLVAAVAWQHIDQPGHYDPKHPIDVPGIALLAVGLGSLQYVLEEGHREGWFESTWILVMAAVSTVSLVTLVVHELEVANPVVDFRVFANRGYTAATVINFLSGTALFSANFLFSLYCGAVMHYTALDIGLLFLKSSSIQILVMPLIGRFGAKVDARALIAFGVLVMCWSLWTNAHLTSLSSSTEMATPLLIRAFGLGAVFVPINVLALGNVPTEKRNNASGLFNLTRELGGSIGTAWMSTQLDANWKLSFARLSEYVTAYDPNTMEQLGTARGLLRSASADGSAADVALALLHGRIEMQALVRGFEQSFAALNAAFLVGILFVPLLQPSRRDSPSGGATH